MSSKSSGSSDFSLARSEFSLTSRPDRRNPAPSCLTVYLSAESLRSESIPESPQSGTSTTPTEPHLLQNHHHHHHHQQHQHQHQSMEEKQLITPRDKVSTPIKPVILYSQWKNRVTILFQCTRECTPLSHPHSLPLLNLRKALLQW